MNKKYNRIMDLEENTRRKNHRLLQDLSINRKDYLWMKCMKAGGGIAWQNLTFLDENLYLNIPFPLKQQKR